MTFRKTLGAGAFALAATLATIVSAQDARKMGYTAIDLTNPYFIALTDGMKEIGRASCRERVLMPV